MGDSFPPVSVVVPNWEGEKLLPQYLPSVEAALKAYPGKSELIVVDDASRDGSVEWLRKHFPSVHVVRLETHGGYGAACNAGVGAAAHEIIFLVNNDMELLPAAISEGVKGFADPSVFGVRLGIQMQLQKSAPLDLEDFALGLELRRGKIEIPMKRMPMPRENWEMPSLSGGACALRKSLFLKWGGYDLWLAPAYWEDVDLSLKAGREGMKILFEPRALCFHEGRGTTGRFFSEKELRRLSERNRYLLAWKHLQGGGDWGRHLFWIPLELLGNLVSGNFARVGAFFDALGKISGVGRRRRELKNLPVKWNALRRKWEAWKKLPPYF